METKERERHQLKGTILGSALVGASLVGLGYVYVQPVPIKVLTLGPPLLLFAVGVGLYSERGMKALLDVFEAFGSLLE